MDPAVITGAFTLGGVAVTGFVALAAAWIKFKADIKQELHRERRASYATFLQATADVWFTFWVVWNEINEGRTPSPSMHHERDLTWKAWGASYMDMSLVASDEVWQLVEPLLRSFRRAYFDTTLPPEDHEIELRSQMRKDVGR